MSGLPASQVLLDDVEAAVRNGATTIEEVIAQTGRGRRAVKESLMILVDLEEIFAARSGLDGRAWVYSPTREGAERLSRAERAERTPAQPHAARAGDGDVAAEFLTTRRRRWSAQLERLGHSRHSAERHVAALRCSADWRALLHELGGAVAVVGSLAASAVALFLL